MAATDATVAVIIAPSVAALLTPEITGHAAAKPATPSAPITEDNVELNMPDSPKSAPPNPEARLANVIARPKKS